MTRRVGVALLAVFVATCAAAAQTALLAEVRVHGNHTTPDAEILSIAGLSLGAAVDEMMLDAARRRLEQSGRFASVELRKRFRSIENPNDVLVIILVDEVAGVTADDLMPGPLKRLRSRGMWLPVVDYAEGYGLTYGARITFVDALGRGSRLSTPLTWGGERHAAAEVDRTFRAGLVSRVEGAVSITRRVNPHFELADTRREGRARVERTLASWLRAGAGVRKTFVSFGGRDSDFVAPMVDLTVDTRTEPAFPRNAVHAIVGTEQLRFGGGHHVMRWTSDVRGYIGLFGSSVLALRAATSQAGKALPPFEQALLGGTATLRGYGFGYRADDNLAMTSAELRVPLTSPLFLGRLGVKAFVDAGAVYPHGAQLGDQVFDRSAGGGVFMSWAVVRLGLDAASPLRAESRKPRWHLSLGVTF